MLIGLRSQVPHPLFISWIQLFSVSSLRCPTTTWDSAHSQTELLTLPPNQHPLLWPLCEWHHPPFSYSSWVPKVVLDCSFSVIFHLAFKALDCPGPAFVPISFLNPHPCASHPCLLSTSQTHQAYPDPGALVLAVSLAWNSQSPDLCIGRSFSTFMSLGKYQLHREAFPDHPV